MSLLLDTLKQPVDAHASNSVIENIDNSSMDLSLEEIEYKAEPNDINHKAHIKNYDLDNFNDNTTNNIENKQSFSDFIYKINLHRKREKLNINISIIILISFILIIIGLYFYIQTQISIQKTYLPENNIDLYNSPISAAINSHNNTGITKISAEKLLLNNSTPVKNIIKPAKSVTTKKSLMPKIGKAPKSNSVNLLRTKKVDSIYLLINEAYRAFHVKQYSLSEKLYTQALNLEPKNRDALLGLAAIGIKEKRYEFSRQQYQHLLRLNPADNFAIAGLSSIEKHLDFKLSESQLKFMLKQHPDSAHLYFALGTQYSAQLKWPEAQSAYFSAWSIDNKNADYCYNLAVSLDHLNKKKQALHFYKLSLTLQSVSNNNFSSIEIEQRIIGLQASIQ